MKWDPQLYDEKHHFVYEYGKVLLSMLQAQPGERILDIGCGTGVLTHQLANSGAWVTGIDKSPEMVAKAAQSFPAIEFLVQDVVQLTLNQQFDAILSNATLHWVPKAAEAVRCMYQHLKSGGRLVAEFGGAGNVHHIVQALRATLSQHGFNQQANRNVWYFPTPEEYTKLLREHGFRVEYCQLHPRPTPLKDQQRGITDWLRMFGAHFFDGIEPPQVDSVIEDTQSRLKETNYQNHQWYADYVRIRVMACKD